MWRFDGKAVYTKIPARVQPLIGPILAPAGIGPIGGQTPAETFVYSTFPPKLHLFTTPGRHIDMSKSSVPRHVERGKELIAKGGSVKLTHVDGVRTVTFEDVRRAAISRLLLQLPTKTSHVACLRRLAWTSTCF